MAYFKCGNVSGNDDSMEWKFWTNTQDSTSTSSIKKYQLPPKFNELLIHTDITNSNYYNSTLILGKPVIENMVTNSKTYFIESYTGSALQPNKLTVNSSNLLCSDVALYIYYR